DQQNLEQKIEEMIFSKTSEIHNFLTETFCKDNLLNEIEVYYLLRRLLNINNKYTANKDNINIINDIWRSSINQFKEQTFSSHKQALFFLLIMFREESSLEAIELFHLLGRIQFINNILNPNAISDNIKIWEQTLKTCRKQSIPVFKDGEEFLKQLFYSDKLNTNEFLELIYRFQKYEKEQLGQ
ncbi:27079_t:CDS:1, partial [Dentiscutata erythropus]